MNSEKLEIVIYVYNGLTMLDAIGPYEVLRCLSNTNIKLVAKDKGLIISDSQLVRLNVLYDIKEVTNCDVLIIPGSSISFIKEMKDKMVLDWIKQLDRTSQKTVSVCSGSVILAATGLLTGRKATSHWKVVNMLAEFGIKPVRERYVVDGKYITAAGVSAGIDMALYLAKELRGEIEARAAQLTIEYDPDPLFASGNYLTAKPEIIELAEKQLKKEAKKDLSLWKMFKNAKTLFKLRK